MKTLFVTLLLALMSFIFGQNNYDQSMKEALTKYEKADTQEQFLEVAETFDAIAEKNLNQWEPRYYAVLGKTIHAFYLSPQEAFKNLKEINKDFQALTTLINNDETLVLKGLILTVKVAKDPMTYGQQLTPQIMATYHKARKSNPENPRPLYQIARYEIQGAPFMGKDPKSYCPLLKESILLFEQEAQTKRIGYEPRWGRDKAEELYKITCSK